MQAVLYIVAIILFGVAAVLAGPNRSAQAGFAAVGVAVAAFAWPVLSTLG